MRWLNGAPRGVRWGAAVAWMAVIFYLSAQPDLPHPSVGWLDLAISCAAHVFVYAVLALLLAWALGAGRRALLSAFALAMLYGLSDEFHQSFVPGRVADPLDVVCNAAGAAGALGGLVWVQRVLEHARSSR